MSPVLHSMETHTLGAGQFVEFILTRERNETQNDDVNFQESKEHLTIIIKAYKLEIILAVQKLKKYTKLHLRTLFKKG